MRISITQKEYEAICFVADQAKKNLGDCKGDDVLIMQPKNSVKHLLSVCEKFHKARVGADELNDLRSHVRSRNGWMPQAQVDKMARGLRKEKNKNCPK